MKLTQDQCKTFEAQGYLFIDRCFSEEEMGLLKAELSPVLAESSVRRVMETNGKTVRSVYGSHVTNKTCNCLSRHPRLVRPCMQLLNSEVYIYQFKINVKAAFDGDVWPWHQDFTFWLREDGLQAPRVVTAMLFLDDVDEFNGPLFLIPGSHQRGTLDVPPAGADSSHRASGGGHQPTWISNVTADLNYSLDRPTLRRLAAQLGMVSIKGPQGSLLIFHSNVVHGSPGNISPFDRQTVLVSFSSTANVPTRLENRRPEFLTPRDCTAVQLVNDGALQIPRNA